MAKDNDRSKIPDVDLLDRYMNWRLGDESCTIEPTILGKGQFGEVRLGKWYGSMVAVKTLHNYDIAENEHLFEKEIRLMKELHHPCVVQFLGFSTERSLGGLAIIMEYLGNGSVEEYILNHKVSLDKRLQWCSQMAQGLAYLHNRKPEFLIHRDVKPSNFMLTQSLMCKLGDFGISRLFPGAVPTPTTEANKPQKEDSEGCSSGNNSITGSLRMAASKTGSSRSSRTNSGGAFNAVGALLGLVSTENELEQTCNVGTSRYMAPEVREHLEQERTKAKYSVQVDVFSLGMVYYFVFEGTIPRIDGATTPSTYHAALREGKRPLFHRSPELMRRIIGLCLRTHPTERPTSRELIKLLDGVTLSKKTLFSSVMKVRPSSFMSTEAEALYQQIDHRKKPSSNPPSEPNDPAPV